MTKRSKKESIADTMMLTDPPPATGDDEPPRINWQALDQGLRDLTDADLGRLHRMVVELFSTAEPESPTRH
jgi:hypothetical protein